MSFPLKTKIAALRVETHRFVHLSLKFFPAAKAADQARLAPHQDVLDASKSAHELEECAKMFLLWGRFSNVTASYDFYKQAFNCLNLEGLLGIVAL